MDILLSASDSRHHFDGPEAVPPSKAQLMPAQESR
jgi:hypothetical protein